MSLGGDILRAKGGSREGIQEVSEVIKIRADSGFNQGALGQGNEKLLDSKYILNVQLTMHEIGEKEKSQVMFKQLISDNLCFTDEWIIIVWQ